MKSATHISILVLSLLAGCAQLPPRPTLPDATAIAPTQATPLDQLTAPLEAEHPGQSAFRLDVEGTEAFVSRVQSARLATRSLDVQGYIWHVDLTGRYFVQELLLAADRGVRVRMLLDDMDARNENATFAALAAHPSIEVRTFNPFASRHGALRFVAEATTSFERINRRMHNKSWIADNRIAIVGGRNIGEITMKKKDAQTTHVGASLVPLVQAAQMRLSIISPYFVPGEEVTTKFGSMVKDGREIRILTNTLAANDVAAVHGGYSRHRQDLLEGGVKIWELKPLPGMEDNASLFGSSGASLHTKAFAVDGRGLFVGSYNLDPRSTWLNCEQGVFAQSEPLALQLEEIFDGQTAGEHAWQVSLDAGKLHWTDGSESLDHEPHASMGRRFQAWFARTLRLDAQL